MTSAASLDQYLRTRRTEIDAALDSVLPAPPTCPPLIAEAMRYTVFSGGKRIRPILALAAAEAVMEGQSTDLRARSDLSRVMTGACAVELVHTYSLVHDDLPAMDDDSLRRGRPTAHVVFGEGIAILAGDALLTQAFIILAQHEPTDPPEAEHRRIRTIACIAEAAGADGSALLVGPELSLEAATSMDHVENPMLLPGITMTTGPNDFAPIEAMQLQRFNGETWELFGEIIHAESS